MVSHFPFKVYDGVEDLVEKIIARSNCRSCRVTLAVRGDFDFALPEPIYVYTDFIKSNFVGDFYLRLLTSLYFPSATGYRRFNYLSKCVRYIESTYTVLLKSTFWRGNRSGVQGEDQGPEGLRYRILFQRTSAFC